MNTSFQKAKQSDLESIWEILQQAIEKRKSDGSNQWQDGYPNPTVIANDIQKEIGYVMLKNQTLVGYVTIAINDEPAYKNLDGKWLTNKDYIVFHRMAIANDFLGQGLARKMFNFIESFAIEHEIKSIKADTNFDNAVMLSLFKKFDYQYCGEVYFRGAPRKAYEKVLEV